MVSPSRVLFRKMLAAQTAIINPDWNFKEMGIGGLHQVPKASSLPGILQYLMLGLCVCA